MARWVSEKKKTQKPVRLGCFRGRRWERKRFMGVTSPLTRGQLSNSAACASGRLLNGWAWTWKFRLCVIQNVRTRGCQNAAAAAADADACTGVARHRLVGSLQAHAPLKPLNPTPVQLSWIRSSPVQSGVPKSAIPVPWFSLLLSDCPAAPQGLPNEQYRPRPVPPAICSGKIHYSPGESCSALSLRQVYAAAGSIFTLEIRTTPSLFCKHIWNFYCTLQHWWPWWYCVTRGMQSCCVDCNKRVVTVFKPLANLKS